MPVLFIEIAFMPGLAKLEADDLSMMSTHVT